MIVPQLRRDVPAGTPTYVLEPGIDCSVFAPRLGEEERHERRERLGFSKTTILIVYPGNVHEAIQRDIFSLYTAIRLFRAEGLDVQMLRTGMWESVSRTSTSYRLAEGVKHLGCVPRAEIPILLDLADIYIWPGWLNPFNASRLPSKLLEFLAMGRPTIVSKVSLGARLENDKNAIIMPGSGGAKDIVDAVKRLIASSDLARAVGSGGREYAQQHFSWGNKVDVLEGVDNSLFKSRVSDSCYSSLPSNWVGERQNREVSSV
jgi:glycosyltransferase involved in cell wall biosynthesis